MTVPARDGHGLELVGVDELAQRLGRDRRWVYRKVADHGLPAIKLGRELSFQIHAVEEWLAKHRVGSWPA